MQQDPFPSSPASSTTSFSSFSHPPPSSSSSSYEPDNAQFSSLSFVNVQGGDGNMNGNGDGSLPMILCCMCGTKIQSNPANMCVNCLKSQVDITEGITKQVTLFWCRGCGRYQRPPWVDVALESREMLALCLKKIKGLNKEVKLVDAGFIWTEPHSRRIKVKLTIQKEVFNSAILQQVFVVDFIVQNLQCESCQKSYTEHTWQAAVQVRQRVKHKRTFLFLEQLLLKHNVVDRALNVKEQPSGLDFYFSNKSTANHLLDFLRTAVPIRSKASKKLISQDDNSNVYNYKYTMYAEIAPVCKDDLVMVETKLVQSLGGISPLMLVSRVTATITLLDPITLKLVEVSGGTYWHHPFRSVLTGKQMIEYVVLDIVKIDSQEKESQSAVNDARPFNKQSMQLNNKLCLANVTLARVSDIGVNDVQYECVTHLGHMLRPGDNALGYDLTNANVNENIKIARGRALPEVMLVKKSYPNKKGRARKRKFVVKTLTKEEGDKVMKKNDIIKQQEEMEEFLQEIEEDAEMQSKVNLYRKKTVHQNGMKGGGVAAAGAGVNSTSNPAAAAAFARAQAAAAAAAANDSKMMDEDGSAQAGDGAGEEEDGDDEGEFPEIDMDQLLDDMGAVGLNDTAAVDGNSRRVNFSDSVDDVEPEGEWDIGGAAGSNASGSGSSSGAGGSDKKSSGKKGGRK